MASSTMTDVDINEVILDEDTAAAAAAARAANSDDDDSIDPDAPSPQSLMQAFKDELGPQCDGVRDEYLLPFLKWKPDVKRAAERYREFLKWKASNKGFFDESLRVSKDPELERLILSEVVVSPPNLLTKKGGPLLIGRFRNNDMTDGRTVDGVCRMLFYTLDQLMQRPETQEHGVTVVHDLRGFDKGKNSRLQIAKRLFHLYGHFPVQIKAIYICHASSVFMGFFKIVSTLVMTKKVRSRIRFVNDFNDLDTKFGVMSPNDLFTDMGGTTEWSVKDWVEDQKRKELSGDSTVWSSFTEIDPPVATKQ